MTHVMTRARNGTRRSTGDLATAVPSVVKTARLRTKVWLEVEGQFAIGDGGLCLLQGIVAHGSLLGAAREMGWSYRHAWGYLKRAEEVLGRALTAARPGKGASRGMVLTDTGRQIVERLAAFRHQIDTMVGPTGPTPEEMAERGRRRRNASARRAIAIPARSDREDRMDSRR
jgi:molybdate transport system regulatory protein